MRIITHSDEINDTWLSSVVGKPLQIIERRSNPAFSSAIVHLTVNSMSPEVPQHLIVKLNANGDGEFEVKFYQLAAPHMNALPMLPRTLAVDHQAGHSYIVQEDLSSTHYTTVTREDALAGHGVPSKIHLEQMTDALAQFHAYWWEHPDLKTSSIPIRPWYGNKAEFDAHVQRREREWGVFQTKVENFSEELHQFYTDLLARLPQLWEKYLEPRITPFRGLTMSNGDCYFAQFLCAKAENPAAQAYLVDFQEASGNFCTFDLVFMFAVFWTPQQRQEEDREQRLLQRYHQVLCQHGVNGYSWEDLMQDYRLMLSLIVFFPIFDAASGAWYEYWWTKMQRLVANFRDLDCWSLFET